MTWHNIPYLWMLAISSVVSAILFVHTWEQWRAKRLRAFTVLCLIAVLWPLLTLLEMSADTLPAKLWYANLQYPCYVTLPVAYLLLAVKYIGLDHWLTRRRVLALCIIPVLTVLLVFTSAYHGLMRYDVFLDTTGEIAVVSKHYGPWFWLHTVYSYTLILTAMVLFVRYWLSAHPLYRGQSVVILAGLLIPLCWNIAYILPLGFTFSYDLSPAFLSVSILVTAWGLFRYRLFDVSPVARNTVIESMSDSMMVIDTLGRVVDLNPAAERILGITAAEAIGMPATKALSAWPELIARYKHTMSAHDEITLPIGERNAYYDLRITPLTDRRRRVLGRLIMLHDITTRKRAEEALRASEARYRTIFDNAGASMLIVEEDNTISTANAEFAEAFGFAPEMVVGRRWTSFLVHEDTEQALLPSLPVQEGVCQHECRWQDRAGKVTDILLTMSAIPDSNAHVLSLIDITERKRDEAKMRRLAFHDPLTGLSNRGFFQRRLTQELAHAARKGEIFAVMLLDLDYFKDVNDTFGHDVGDKVLCRVAQRLQQTVREGDIISRLGGDEFILLLPDLPGPEDAVALARRLLEVFAKPILLDSLEIDLQMSIGISLFPQDGMSADLLVKHADDAMYAAKRVGKNIYCLYREQQLF